MSGIAINNGGGLTINSTNNIIGIQCGVSQGNGTTNAIQVNYPYEFKNSNNIIVTLTPISTGGQNMNCPQLYQSISTSSYFEWYAVFNSGGSYYYGNGTYYITWMAIQYS